MKIFMAIGIILTTLLLPAQAIASESELRLKILPMDCIFEIINDGSGELYYVTPEECGELVEPEPGDDSADLDRDNDSERDQLHDRKPNDEITDVGGNEPERDAREFDDTSEDETSEKTKDDTPTHATDQSESLPLAGAHRHIRFGVIIFAAVSLLAIIIYIILHGIGKTTKKINSNTER